MEQEVCLKTKIHSTLVQCYTAFQLATPSSNKSHHCASNSLTHSASSHAHIPLQLSVHRHVRLSKSTRFVNPTAPAHPHIPMLFQCIRFPRRASNPLASQLEYVVVQRLLFILGLIFLIVTQSLPLCSTKSKEVFIFPFCSLP